MINSISFMLTAMRNNQKVLQYGTWFTFSGDHFVVRKWNTESLEATQGTPLEDYCPSEGK